MFFIIKKYNAGFSSGNFLAILSIFYVIKEITAGTGRGVDGNVEGQLFAPGNFSFVSYGEVGHNDAGTGNIKFTEIISFQKPHPNFMHQWDEMVMS